MGWQDLDFGPLASLPQVYRQTQNQAHLDRTLAGLGPNPDLARVGAELLRTNPAVGMSLLGLAQQDKFHSPEHLGRIARTKAEIEAEFAPKTTNIKTPGGDEVTVEKGPQGYRVPQISGMPAQPIDGQPVPPGVDPKEWRKKLANELAETYALKPKAEAAVRETHANIDRLAEAAKKIRDNPSLWRVTGAAGQLPSIGAAGPWRGEAASLEAQIESMVSQTGLNTLNAMREASKTGGAVGNVTEKEWPILQSNLAATNRKQSPEEYRKNLDAIIKWGDEAKQRTKQAYDETYSRFDRKPQQAQQPQQQAGIPKPTSKAGYDNLPKGAQYIAPDGSLRTKQ